MFKQIITYVALLTLSLPLFSQLYTGVNTIELTSEGAESSTHLTSNQLVASLAFERSELSLLSKTGSFYLLANEEDKRLLLEEFMIESNRLLAINIDISSLNPTSSQSFKHEDISLPYVLSFGGESLEGVASISLVYDKEKELITFSLDLDTSISKMGVRLSENYKKRLSDALDMSIQSGTLTRRY